VNDEEVAESILGYLSEHPQAMDTAEGIAEWWIMRQQIRVTVTALTRALQGLTEKGLVEELRDGEQRRYRLLR
jgi:DNA-binding MarR family transcriptional regulator